MDADFPVRRHLTVLRRSFRSIIAFTVLGLLVALAVNAISPRRYESTATILVGPVLSDAQPDTDSIIAAQRVAVTYAQLAATPLVLDKVRAQLGITEPLDDFRGRLVAQAASESLFIEITFQDPDPAQAALVAQAVADALVEAAPAGTPPAEGEAGLRQLQVVGRAVPATVPNSPRTLLNLLAGVAAGLLAGLVIAYLRAYIRDDLDQPEDAADIAGVPSLGRIGSDMTADGVDATALARLAKRLELVDAKRARLLLVRAGNSDAGWLGEELAAHYAQLGRSTLLLRLDAQGRAATGAATGGFERLLAGATSEPRQLLAGGADPQLRILHSGSGLEAAAEAATRDRAATAVETLSTLADQVVIVGDAPADSVATLIVAPASTAVVLVVDPDRTRRREIAGATAILRSVGARIVGLVLVDDVRLADRELTTARVASAARLAPSTDRPGSG